MTVSWLKSIAFNRKFVRVLFATLVASVIWNCRRRAIGVKQRLPAHVPLAPGFIPVIGHLIACLRNRRRMAEYWLEMRRSLPDPKQTFVLTVPFAPPMISSIDPRSVEYVLKSNFEAFEKGPYFFHRMHDLLGHGIFVSDGQRWKMQRKIIANLFSLKNFREFVACAFKENVQVMNAKIAEMAPDSVDFYDLIHRYMMDSFMQIAFGVNDKTLTHRVPVADAIDAAQEHVARRFGSPFWFLEETFLPIGAEHRRNIKMLRAFSHDVVRRRLAQVKDVKREGRNTDVVALYLNARAAAIGEDEGSDEVLEEELTDFVVNLMLAGRDTTASSVSWTIYELAQSPRVVARLLNEIKTVVGTSDAPPPTYEQLKPSSMPYVHAVFHEAMRLHAPVPMNAKVAVVDCVLPDGTPVPKGSVFTWETYAMGKLLTDVWGPDIAEFRPERWLRKGNDGSMTLLQPSQFDYPVFHAGPRICLGKTMGETQGAFVLIELLRHWDIQVTNIKDVALETGITLRMRVPPMCVFKKREW